MKVAKCGRISSVSKPCPWIALFLMSVLMNVLGIYGRGVGLHGFLSNSPATESEHDVLRTYILQRRWRRDSMIAQREHCALLAAPWVEAEEQQMDLGKLFRLRVVSLPMEGSSHVVFPGQSLFHFVRKVYRCCQMGFHCGSVKGIQGRLRGETDVEFHIKKDVVLPSLRRAEIHLQFVNPDNLDIQPVLSYMAKRKLPTRYSLWSGENIIELRVDLLLLFQGLQEAAGSVRGGPSLVDMRRIGELTRGGPREKLAPQSLQDTDADPWGEGLGHLWTTLELGLALICNKGGLRVSCELSGVHLLHAPFISLSYR